jgi:hypothetical protein
LGSASLLPTSTVTSIEELLLSDWGGWIV